MSEPLSGIALLKQVTRREWLLQPQGDFSLFRSHPALDARWNSGKPWVVCYDKNAMYLGAASSAKLGVGPFSHSDKPDFVDQAGVWRIFLHEPPKELAYLPPIAPYGSSWQYTPVVLYLAQTGYKFDIEEAYVFAEQHAVLRRFYEQMKELRECDKPAAKAMYTRTFGVLAHLPPEHWTNKFYRPDWFFTLVAEAKMRMYLQVQKTYRNDGVLPVAIQVDSLYFDQEVPSLPIGEGIGQFKITRATTE